MIANYHAHTWRCHHAHGREREYVERAIEGGLQIFGFSDHVPHPFPKGFCSPQRMTCSDLDGYVQTVLDLKKEYKNDLEIHLGFEAEYYPAFFEQLRDLLRGYPVEYFLLGQHFLGNEIGEPCITDPCGDDLLIRYCAQVKEAMATGCFTYLAHPDMIRYQGDDKALYTEQMTALCEAAKQNGLPLEINFAGISGRRHYPNPAFWEIAGTVGCDVILGCDAHSPRDAWNPEALAVATEMVRKYRLRLLDTVPLRDPLL